MVELTLDTLAIDADIPSQEALEGGAQPVVAAQVVGGSALPLADPTNPQRPLRFPSMAVNFALAKENALAFAKLLKEKAEQLPDAPQPSGKLITATNISEAEAVAEAHRRMKG